MRRPRVCSPARLTQEGGPRGPSESPGFHSLTIRTQKKTTREKKELAVLPPPAAVSHHTQQPGWSCLLLLGHVALHSPP